MKIQRLHRIDIVDDRWNEFIDQTPEGNVYAKTWFLDTIPQEWGALVALEGDKWVGVLPFQLKKKYGFSKVQQDAFTNELGIFHLSQYPEAVPALLKKFRRFPFISHYRFNYKNPVPASGGLPPAHTFHLRLHLPIGELRKGYSKNLERNLQKAKSRGIWVEKGNGVEPLIQLFKANVHQKINGIEEYQYDLLRKIFSVLSEKRLTKVFYAYTPDHLIASGAMIVRSGDHLVYFFGASSEIGKKLNSQPFLLDSILAHYCHTDTVFDFEGGATAGLDRFYSSFGATRVDIPKYRNMLFGLLP